MELISRLSDCYKKSNCYDFLYGAAGTLTLLVNLFSNKDLGLSGGVIKEIAFKIYNDLLSVFSGHGCNSYTQDEVTINTGFSHGLSGVIFSLCKFHQTFGGDECISKIIDLITLENSYKKNNSWKDLRSDVVIQDGISIPKWCHGEAGILISRMEAKKTLLNIECGVRIYDEICQDIDICVDNILNHGLGNGYTLCHGDPGNLICLSKYNKSINKKSGEAKINAMMLELIYNFVQESVLKKESSYNSSLMVGYSSVAYMISYFIDNNVPNVLNLDFPNTTLDR